MYKSVVILGKDLPLIASLEELLSHKDIYVLGSVDSGSTLDEIKEKLSGNIGAETRIDILAHGRTDEYIHKISLDGSVVTTGELFEVLAGCTDEALDINIKSCQSGGLSREDVQILPYGSMVAVSTGKANYSSYADYGYVIEHALLAKVEDSYNKYEEYLYNMVNNPSGTKCYITTEVVKVFGGDINYYRDIYNDDFLQNRIDSFKEFCGVLDLEFSANEHKDMFNSNIASFVAFYSNFENIKKFLVSYDYNQEIVDHMLANTMMGGSIEKVNLLLSLGANPNYEYIWSNDGVHTKSFTALQMATIHNDIELVKILISAGADVNATDREEGETVLQEAAIKGNIQLIKELLSAGADIHAMNFNGDTALIQAVAAGKVNAAKFLIDMGANIEHEGADGLTPLHISTMNGNVAMTHMLLEQGANIEHTTSDGGRCIHEAASSGNVTVLNQLIMVGADVGAITNEGYDLLHVATQADNIGVAELLLAMEYGDIQSQDIYGRTVLYDSCVQGNTGLVQLFLEYGADYSSFRTQSGYLPIHGGAMSGNVGVMMLLMNAGANIDMQNNFGFTPLHLAASANDLEMVEFLVNNGANIYFRNNNGDTALHLTDDQEVADILIEAGLAEGIYNNNSEIAWVYDLVEEDVEMEMFDNSDDLQDIGMYVYDDWLVVGMI